jgi:NAD(P)-dependent dehydrogenase (short-subunit alcohol dehydrogenase family)
MPPYLQEPISNGPYLLSPPTFSNRGKPFRTSHTDNYPAVDRATKSNHRGHYVLITGASKGVGRATALSFAKAGAAGIALAVRSSFGTLSSGLLSAAESANKPAPKILELQMDVVLRLRRSSRQDHRERIREAGYPDQITRGSWGRLRRLWIVILINGG